MSADTECSTCSKLDLFCASYELSAVSSRCLRCNHQEKDHNMTAGLSKRPFPLFLFPVSNTKEILSLHNLPPNARGSKISKQTELTKENDALRAELTRLQADLRSAQNLITEITTGNSLLQTSTSYNSRCRDAGLSQTGEDIDKYLFALHSTKKQKPSTITSPRELTTLTSRLTAAKKHQDTSKHHNPKSTQKRKVLLKHVSRHTLITREFISSHFDKLKTNQNPLPCPVLFKNMIEEHTLYIERLVWLQEECFEGLKATPMMKKEDFQANGYGALFDFLLPIIEEETKVLSMLKSLPFDKHDTIRVWIELAPEMPLVIANAQKKAIAYALAFPSNQILLENLFEEYPESSQFFQKQERKAQIGFSKTLLSPMRHASNYTTFFTEILEMLRVTDKWFKEYVSILSSSRKIEKELCDISASLTQNSSSIRSQIDLFSHKSGLIYNSSRELRKQSPVMVYHPERSKLPFFQRFLKANLYVFSDSIIFDYRSFDNDQSLRNMNLAGLVRVGDSSHFSLLKLPPLAKMAPLLESSFTLVTLDETILVVADTLSLRVDLVSHISESFYHFVHPKATKNQIPFKSLIGDY